MTASISLSSKRILFLHASLDLGGAVRQSLVLARHLREVCGSHVEVWGFGNHGRTSELCNEMGIPCKGVVFPWEMGRIRRVRRLFELIQEIRKARFEILLPYTFPPNVLCGLIWRWTGARLCVWNQRDGGMRLDFKVRAESWAVRQTPWFISNSQPGIDFLVGELGVRRERIGLIRNGVELQVPEATREEWRQRLGISADAFVACMVANVHVEKDHLTLLRAWRTVVDRIGKQRAPVLLLAGRLDDGAHPPKALAYDLELGRSVRFLGAVKDVVGLLGSVDIGVFSSRSEGCPNGVLECMAVGLPVAATDIPGIRDTVGEDGSRYLAPVGDPDGFAQKILALQADPAQAKEVGATARRRVESVFNPRKMCEDSTSFLIDRLAVAK